MTGPVGGCRVLGIKMIIRKNIRRILCDYKRDDRGNIAMIFGLSFMFLMLAVGVGYDYSQLTHAHSKSQSVADQTALQAAIYVKNNGGPPPSSADGPVHNQTYKASELGHQYNGFVKDGADGVNVKVTYDALNKEATAHVTGKTVPAFLQIFNYENLHFNVSSTVNYEEKAPQNPASIMLVLDNSGSMYFDDKPLDEDGNDLPTADRRIDGLIGSVTNFMDVLRDNIDENAPAGERLVRTHMVGYNDGIINVNGPTNPGGSQYWGIIDQNNINAMAPGGATNSHPPMEVARDWINAENEVHFTETGEDNPLRFVIFMTDGQNTEGYNEWIQEEDTGQWRGVRCNRRYCYYVYHTGETQPNYGFWWQEGRLVYSNDYGTELACQSMEEGVTIYTIGYALQSGWFETNEWANEPGGFTPRYTDEELRLRASSLLNACASGEGYFITADNTQELEQAFQAIGNNIVTQLLRIKS